MHEVRMQPQRIGRYEVQRELGRGAMGIVYLAHDPAIGRSVAIKTVCFETGLSEPERAEAQQRFRREAQAAGRLIHPHIVTVLDVGEFSDGDLFIAMEYIAGPSLDRFARPAERLAPDRVVHFVCQAGEALAFAHRHRIVHRDLKPANLMIADGDRLKVTDFGLAKDPGTDLTHSGTLIGTPSYMSPEQIAGKQLDGRSDLFSLGVVLFELLAGQKPFPGDSISTVIYRILNEEPPDLTELEIGFSPALASIARKALHKDPAQRFQTGSELARVLRDFQNGVRSPATVDTTQVSEAAAVPAATASRDRRTTAPPPGPSEPRKPGGWTKPVVLSLVAMLLVGTALIMFVPRVRHAVRGVVAPTLLAVTPMAQRQEPGRWMPLTADHPGAVFRLDGEPIAGDQLVREPSLVGKVVTASDGCLQGSHLLDEELPTGELQIALTDAVRSPIPIRTEPAGAAILVDGSDTGQVTPATVSLEACAPHRIEMSRPGFEPARLRLPAEADWLALTAEPLTLAALPDGILRLEADYKLYVFENGKRIGESGRPLSLAAGAHSLMFGNRKHRIKLTQEVEILPAEETVLWPELPPLGEVRINAHPGNATILVDGLEAGPPPLVLSLAAGTHEVACRWNVGVPRGARREVEVQAGDANSAVNFRQRR